MPRLSLLKSLFAFAVVLSLVAGSALPISAQGGDTLTEEGSPPPEQEIEPQYGFLQVSAISCSGADAGTVNILLASEYAPPGECVDGANALLIDGVDYGAVAPYLELQLEAGVHSLYDPNSGAARDIEVYADSATSVVILTITAPAEPTPEPIVEPAEIETGGLLIVAHSCNPDVQTVDQLYALGNLTSRLNACPAFTLPGYSAPGGAVSGGELWYDFTLAPSTGSAQSLTENGDFVPDAFCESSIGALDNDPTNDRCVSNSGFAFELAVGPITLTQTYIPDNMRYVAAETGTGADAGIITGSDPASGYLGLDTSLRGTDRPVVHLFYLNPPRVNIIVHLCGPEIATPDDLVALGSLAAQLLTCPATSLALTSFGVTVTDNNWGPRGLDSAIFDPTVICESDIGDWNGNGSDNVCVDAPTYRFNQTAQGYVAVTQDYAPEGYVFGGVNSTESGVITGVDPAGIVSLDTSYDGDVTVHLFDLVFAPVATDTPTATPSPTKTTVPPTATRTPTRTPVPPTATRTATNTPVLPTATPTATNTPTRTATVPGPTHTATTTPTTPTPTSTSTPDLPSPTPTVPTGTGTLTVAALYCLSGSGTTVVALPPGQQATAADLGGSDCFAGDATIQLTLADGSSVPGLKLGRDGVESIQNIPTTDGSTHTLTEGLTGQSAAFEIATGTVTRVIIRFGAGTAMVDENVNSTGGTTGSTTGTTGGLVTDELIGDEGVASSAGSYSGISFTTLVIDDVDAQAVSSVKDAKSLPGVGVFPMKPTRQYVALMAAFALLMLSAGFAARRSARHTP